MVGLNNNKLLPETAPSICNEKILSSAGDCFKEQIVKDKENCAGTPASFTKINKQIVDYIQQKRVNKEFDSFQKTARSGVSDGNCIINKVSPEEIKHTWPESLSKSE